MMKYGLYGILLVVFLNLVSCTVGLNPNDIRTTALIVPATSTAINSSLSADLLYFQTDFSKVSLARHTDYIGFNPYNLRMPSNMVAECDLGFSGAIPTYANAKIVTDNNRRVLKGFLYGDDPNVDGVTRFQMDIIPQPDLNLEVYHFSQRMFLNSDLAYLSQFPTAINEFGSKDWTIIFEVWNQFNPDWDGDVGGSARWDLSFAKPAGNKNLYWELSGEYMQPAASQFHALWTPLYNKTVPIPFGQWFTLDFSMKRGQGTAGQLTVSIQIDGGTSQVLFKTNRTTIYPSHPELFVNRISPVKLYMSPSITQFMHKASKNMDIMYNDLKWYKN